MARGVPGFCEEVRAVIVLEEPPNIEQIDAAFGTRGKHGILYAHGGKIYNPSGVAVPPALIVHELTHIMRQGNDSDAWWQKYIEDMEFRYDEELHAHKAELNTRLQATRDRNLRAKIVMETAARLSNPLYKYGRRLSEALKDIK